MANDVKKYSLYLIAIVAIVAVVGIVVLTTNNNILSGTTEVSEESVTTTEKGDLAGQAVLVKGCEDPDGTFIQGDNSPYLYKSTVTSKSGYGGPKTDYCLDKNNLGEAYCLNSGKVKVGTIPCSTVGAGYECVEGACAPKVSNTLNTNIYLEGSSCKGSTSITECIGAKFLITNGNNCEAHLIQITNINVVNKLISFKDLTYGIEQNGYHYLDEILFNPFSPTYLIALSATPTQLNFINLGSCYVKPK